MAYLLRLAAAAALVGACYAEEPPGAVAARYLSDDYFPGMTLLEPIVSRGLRPTGGGVRVGLVFTVTRSPHSPGVSTQAHDLGWAPGA